MAKSLYPSEIGAIMTLVNAARLTEAEQKTRTLLAAYPNAGMLWKILGVALMRQGKDAVPALARTAELLPDDPEAHGNLGAALHDQGRWAESLVSLRRALELRPHDVQSLVDAANCMRALGRARDAVPLYQRVLELSPRLVEAWNNLGNAFLELGQCGDAAGCYRSALHISPDDAQIHCNLGNAQRQLGSFGEALVSSRRAIALDPKLSIAHNNLGLVLVGLGQREEAVASYRRALELNPGYVEALNNLGTALCDLGHRLEAVTLHARAIELDPVRAESHCNLGNVLIELRRIEEAVACYAKALKLKPDYTLAHLSLGAALRQLGRAAEAEASCRAALAIDPNSVAALSVLGELRADRGQFSEAEELFQRAIALDPNFPFSFYSIAIHRKMTPGDTAWLQGTQALLAKPLPLRHEISLRYALGKYFDDVKDYDEAFGHYRRANELTKRYGVTYDRARLVERVTAIIDRHDAESLRQRRSGGHASECPVFIVGMPRSGTTLTEQILSSHPAVFGAGELMFWQTAYAAYESAERRNRLSRTAGGATAGGATAGGPTAGGATAGLATAGGASLLPRMARDYLEAVTALSGGAPRVVDKMPQNFMNLGLIHAAFPQARIIHLRRHPIDTCLSIYFQYFSHLHPYANDLDDLAHFYGEYLRLMDHWRASIPASILLEIPYEALVEDQEDWTRRMLDFVGLPWDPRCLDFHKTDRAVTTFSKWQVRQKIHSSSAGRWKNYEKYLGPLRELTSVATARPPAS